MEVYQLLGDNSFDIETIELSENHKFAINTAIHQIESGDFLTNEQANKGFQIYTKIKMRQNLDFGK